MLGMMQSWPLTVDRILDYAGRRHGAREVVARSVEGPIVRTNYAEVLARAKKTSNALIDLGIQPGDRVGTLAWNTSRHLEVWYGIMGIGAVCHTLNPRLLSEQICWIINNAEDRVIFVDAGFAPMLLANIHKAPSVEKIVVLTDAANWPTDAGSNVLTYEELIAPFPAACVWGGFEEDTACGLCYTSGTTGDPKGVLYSHRSNYLHTLMCLQPDIMGLSSRDTILPVTPMYHANAWGVAFAAPAVGAKLVMPGPKLDGASIHELLEGEGVTMSCAVPTVWQGLLQHLDDTRAKLTTLRRVMIGGAACPESLIRGFRDRYDVEVLHIWGMTETSPVATLGAPCSTVSGKPFNEQMAVRLKQGRPQLGCELKIVDDDGKALPEDGQAFGRLMVRGAIVAGGYFKGAGARCWTRRAGSTPATSPPSIPAATCTSPTGPRT